MLFPVVLTKLSSQQKKIVLASVSDDKGSHLSVKTLKRLKEEIRFLIPLIPFVSHDKPLINFDLLKTMT